jgi:hypothetical protein
MQGAAQLQDDPGEELIGAGAEHGHPHQVRVYERSVSQGCTSSAVAWEQAVPYWSGPGWGALGR